MDATDARLHHALLMTHMRLGHGVAGNDAELVLRGLPSIELRYHAQDATARALATWMQTRPEVVRCCTPRCQAHQDTMCGCAMPGPPHACSAWFSRLTSRNHASTVFAMH